MADTFLLEVATPERLLLQENATEAQIPALNGAIGVLPEHAPLLSILGTGELTFTTANGKRRLFISGGWVQVLHNHVRVIADRAEPSSEIDTSRAETALKRAQERLALPSTAGVDVARAINALHRAEARLAAAQVSRT